MFIVKRYDYQVIRNEKFGTLQYRLTGDADWQTTPLSDDLIGQVEHLFQKRVKDFMFCGYRVSPGFHDEAYYFIFE